MISERLRRAALTLVLAAALPAAALGQTEGEFETTIRDALAEFEAGRWIEARTLFLRAHAIRPSAEALRMAGNASYEARDYVRAVELLESALAAESPALREERAELARQALDAAGRFVTRLTVEVPEGTRVRIDDAVRDTSQPVVLARGEHRIEASAPGFETRREQVRLSSPEESVTLELRPSIVAEDQPPVVATESTVPEREPIEAPPKRSLTWLWVTLGVVAMVAIGVVAVTLGTRDGDPPLGADAPGSVVRALELGP